MFFNADEDEQDFVSPGGSKLASLFGMDKASGQGGNESLTYTAPKQPKKKEPNPESAAAPAVVLASVVHAYKYVDGKYASQSKLGIALLAVHTTKDYRILLYVNRQQQVTNAKITTAFAFNMQPNNYSSFYDDARQMWSVLFDSADAAEKFAKEVAIAKANSSIPALTEVVQQDLVSGEGRGLESGDSVEVKYTGWLFTNGTFGKVFDQSQAENYFRFKVGKGKVIKGWDQGMLGMKKGGKRILVIPSSLAYGSQGVSDRIPPGSTLIFEIQVMRVKLQKGESPHDSPAPTPSPIPVPTTLMPDQDELDGPGVKGRTRSINEHLSQSSDSNKAKLISRMARMGQPMLPFQGAVAAQPDDSDEDQHHHLDHTVPSPVKPALPTKPRSASGIGMAGPSHVGQVIFTQAQPTSVLQPGMAMIGNQPVMVSAGEILQQQQPAFLQNFPGAQQLAVYQNPNTFLQQQQQSALLQQQQQLLQQQLLNQGVGTLPGHPTAFGTAPVVSASLTPQPTSSSSSSSADSLAPVLLTETRQQNTEVRLSLSKMSDKVDRILEKVEHMSAVGSGAHSLGVVTPYGASMPAPSMEANVLMQNIIRIVQENERLKKDVYEQSSKVQEQNEKIATLLDKNQKYVEQSQSVLEQRNEGYKNTASQSQARVLALEQEKVHLATELSSASAQISTLQLDLGEYRKREGELKQQLQATSTTSTSTLEELSRLRLQKEEDEQKISNLTVSIREEKLTRKSEQAKLASLQEEISDLKSTSEALERNLSERKRKALEERRKLEEDLEDAKLNYEQTIEGLREKLRKQKTSVDTEAHSKVSKIEEEVSREWQTKCDRLVASANEKHKRQISDMKQEREELIQKVEELERKLQTVRSSGSSSEHQVSQLQDELAEMKVWKDKYDNLRSQAASMKERYEKRIEELEGEKDESEERRNQIVERAREQRQALLQQIQDLQQQLQQLRTEQLATRVALQQSAPPPPTAASPGAADVATEVKKIMNTVFQTLRGEFDPGDSYTGSEVLSTILNVIKQTTLKLVSQSPTTVPTQVVSEEEEEGEEEDEEEEEAEVLEKEKKAEKAVEKEKEREEASSVTPETEPDVPSVLQETHPAPEVPPVVQELKPEVLLIVQETQLVSEVLPALQETQPEVPPVTQETQSISELPTVAPETKQEVPLVIQETLSVPEDLPLALEPEPEVISAVPETRQEYLAVLEETKPELPATNRNDSERSNDSETPAVEDIPKTDDLFNNSNALSTSLEPSFLPANEEKQDDEDKKADLQDTEIVIEGEETSGPTPAKEDNLFTNRNETDTVMEDFDEPDTVAGKDDSLSSAKDKPDEESAIATTANITPQSEDGQGEPNGPATSKSPEQREAEEKRKQAVLEASTHVAPKPVTSMRETPPLFDEDDVEDEDSPLFGSDNTVSDTLGSDFKPKSADNEVKPANTSTDSSTKVKAAPGKKLDLANDEDLKPQPPPPLFGDSDDDDDLDWLS